MHLYITKVSVRESCSFVTPFRHELCGADPLESTQRSATLDSKLDELNDIQE